MVILHRRLTTFRYRSSVCLARAEAASRTSKSNGDPGYDWQTNGHVGKPGYSWQIGFNPKDANWHV